MKRNLGFLFLALITLLLARPVDAAVRLASVFSDDMVLQRDQPLRVWGDADSGASVEVTLGSERQTATADASGHWLLTFASHKATTEPQDLRVSSGGQETTLHNVLVGDVWLCAGQSNMQMTLAETETGPEEARDAAKQTRIRLLTIPKRPSAKTESRFDAKWRQCSPETAGKSSAVGYYFGRLLADDPALRNIPIGLIDCSFGGTAAEAWTSPEKLRDFNSDQLLPSMFGIAPGQIYNAMIAPLIPLNLTGVLWYQGESNASKPELYPRVLSTMIGDWRDRFQNEKLPFFLVQLPAFVDTKFVWIREAEAQVARDVPGVHVAVTYDTTDGFDLHPKQKREIGRRLSLLARKAVYNENLQATGPFLKSAEFEGSNVRLTFATDGQGLTTSSPVRVTGFEVAGKEGAFRFADARIEGDHVLLHCEAVPEPKYVRYAWSGIPDANLTGKQGLPVSPFRTDALPHDLIELQTVPTFRQITTPAYKVEIDGLGKITSLIVGNSQFLSNAPGASGGTSIPVLFGPRALSNIHVLGPNILSCSDNEVTLLLNFAPDSMTWSVTNRSNSAIQFRTALSSRVKVDGFVDAATAFTLKNQKAAFRVTGLDKTTKGDDGTMLEMTIKPHSTREISFKAN
jgi:sialate O-acetylesterase